MSRPRSILEDPASPAPVAAREPEHAPGPACPRCGAPLRMDQDWCLSCGTAVTTRVVGASGWRTPVAIVASTLAIALIGLVAAFLAVSNDPDEVAQAPANTASQTAQPTPGPATPTPEPDPITPDTIPPASGGDEVPTPTPTDDAPSAGGDDSPSTGGGGSAVGSWPDGKSAWTVVLLSSTRRAGANSRARRLSGDGTEVGVLKSDDFKSLRSGYFVVFSGQYESRNAAENALTGLRSKAPQAYVRRVTPR